MNHFLKTLRAGILCGAALFGLSAEARAETVKSVIIEGTRRIEQAAVLAVVAQKGGRDLDKARVQEDIRAIFRMGYFSDVKVRFDRSSGVLTYSVAEKTVIRETKYEGNDDLEKDDLTKDTLIKPYSYLDSNRIREEVSRIRKLYDEKGYYLADITTKTEDLPNNEARLTFQIREDRKVRLRQITIFGNHVFSDAELKKVMRTKEKGFLSFLTDSGSYREEMFADDRQILRDHYGHHGYIKAKIGAPRVALSPDRTSLSLSFSVEEGDRYTVADLDVDGVLLKPREELKAKLLLKENEIADTRKIQQDIAQLTMIYGDEGYAYVNVIPRDTYDEEKKTVSLTYLLQPGVKVYIERIEFKGNDSTRDKVLRREMQVKEGDLYHGTHLRDSKQTIERLALFGEVKVSTPRGSADDRINVIVEVEEKPTGTFSIGAGFNTLESFQILGTIEKRNLFGQGVDLSLQARVGGRTQAFNLRYRDEWFLDTRLGMTINAFNIARRFTNFDLTSRGATLGFDYPFYVKGLERIRGGLTYGWVSEDIADIRSTVERLFSGGITSSVTATLSRDTRNRVFEPTQGSYYLASQEVAGGPFAGDNKFSKSEFDASWFFPVLGESRAPVVGGSVFAFHFNTGFVTPIHSGDRVPLFERYFPGGILSLRGFQLRSLGPDIDVASSTDPSALSTSDFAVGGNKQIIFNAEYLFPIIRVANIKGVFFFDMGNAFDNGENLFTLSGQRQSVGFGIRWFSPIGPLRFEWGFPLDQQEDESFVVFDFTIGSLF